MLIGSRRLLDSCKCPQIFSSIVCCSCDRLTGSLAIEGALGIGEYRGTYLCSLHLTGYHPASHASSGHVESNISMSKFLIPNPERRTFAVCPLPQQPMFPERRSNSRVEPSQNSLARWAAARCSFSKPLLETVASGTLVVWQKVRPAIERN
jgi:hypothetical protein